MEWSRKSLPSIIAMGWKAVANLMIAQQQAASPYEIDWILMSIRDRVCQLASKLAEATEHNNTVYPAGCHLSQRPDNIFMLALWRHHHKHKPCKAIIYNVYWHIVKYLWGGKVLVWQIMETAKSSVVKNLITNPTIYSQNIPQILKQF